MVSKDRIQQAESTLRAMARANGRAYKEGTLDLHKPQGPKTSVNANDRRTWVQLVEYMKCPKLAAYQTIMCIVGSVNVVVTAADWWLLSNLKKSPS